MKIEESKTLDCLINAFAGESQARNRYTFFAKIAKEEGYVDISNIFLETANNELEHAKLFYKEIPANNHNQVNGMYPFFLGKTSENLKSAVEGETEEWDILYKNSSLIAKEEGFNNISKLFKNISEIEKMHAHRFKELEKNILSEKVFKKTEETLWICTKCGHTQLSKEAPEKCPVCGHPQGYFKINNEKF